MRDVPLSPQTGSSAIAGKQNLAAGPVTLDEVTLTLDETTGEILAWHGLNTDPDRCPAAICTGCDARCRCAPCLCPECVERTRRAADGTFDPEEADLALF